MSRPCENSARELFAAEESALFRDLGGCLLPAAIPAAFRGTTFPLLAAPRRNLVAAMGCPRISQRKWGNIRGHLAAAIVAQDFFVILAEKKKDFTEKLRKMALVWVVFIIAAG